MFHRSNKQEPQPQNSAPSEQPRQSQATYQNMEQTAVQRYIKSQEETTEQGQSAIANQNNTIPYAARENTYNYVNNPTQIMQKKEAQQMNNPQSNDTTKSENAQPSTPAQPQARVDIPGNNFQRPMGAPGAASRPAYPGTYPGAQNTGSSYSAAQANDKSSTGSKLVIGQGITMSGEIEACDHLIVEGTIEAALKGASMLDVAESGSYFGTVEIEEANIAGRFEGDITVRGRLTIESTGTVIGTISYKELSMEAGATIDGSVSPIGSQNAGAQNSKRPPMKSKKVSSNNGAELPFSDRSAAE